LDFIEQEPSLAIEWQAALNRPLLIVTRNPPKRAVQLAFDGRLWHRGIGASGIGGGASEQDKDDDDDNPTSPPPPPPRRRRRRQIPSAGSFRLLRAKF